MAKMREAAPTLATAVELAEEFAALVRGHKPNTSTPDWKRAQDSTVPVLQHFEAAVVGPQHCARDGDTPLEQRPGRGGDQPA